MHDVKRLIKPYPTKACDKVLEAQGDLAGVLGEGKADDESSVDDGDAFPDGVVSESSVEDDDAAPENADTGAMPQSRQHEQSR